MAQERRSQEGPRGKEAMRERGAGGDVKLPSLFTFTNYCMYIHKNHKNKRRVLDNRFKGRGAEGREPDDRKLDSRFVFYVVDGFLTEYVLSRIEFLFNLPSNIEETCLPNADNIIIVNKVT